ncbi:MAG: twin-arginine translocation signal domain-containing protein [Anaerolineae bacterium]
MNGSKATRRDLLKATGVATVGALLAACAPPAAPTQPPQPTQAQAHATAAPPTEPTQATGPTRIAFWYYWGGVWGEACAAVGKAFADANPSIQVDSTSTGGWEKVLSAFAAGSPPDVLLDFSAPSLIPRGQTVPLDDLIAASSVVKKDNYYLEMWECFQWKGQQFGLPAAEAGVDMALVMNKGRCAEAGLDVNNPPQTITEMLVWAEKLTIVGDGGILQQVGFDPMDGTSTNGFFN